MQIKYIRFHRFRGFENLNIEFPKNAKLIIFIGENGSGKTSLIDGMSMILRDTLYKHHRYDAVNWTNPLNVHNAHQYGSISIGIQGAKLTYDFSQGLSVERTRFISEESLALQLKRDLTEEDRMEHYKAQGNMAFDAKIYEKALENYLILVEIQEKILAIENSDLYKTYFNIGRTYLMLEKYLEAINFSKKASFILEKNLDNNKELLFKLYWDIGSSYFNLKEFQLAIDFYKKSEIIKKDTAEFDERLASILYNVGLCHYNLKKYKESLKYYIECLDIREKTLEADDPSLQKTYKILAKTYKMLKNKKEADYYENKAKTMADTDKDSQEVLPKSFQNINQNTLNHFNEYIETWIPLALHYTAKQGSTKNYQDALPIAFDIPMTVNFDMIADWFTELENDENRKRLRINAEYRSPELQTIREVITKGLNLLNGESGSQYTELQTELEDNVKDGQVASWLSIKKNGILLNVNQLSDGEKRVLVLLIDITRRLIQLAKTNKTSDYLNAEGIVLIDEIEQHLHPKWQRNFLPTLHQIFPNLQFVITTHSPLVLGYIKNWENVAAYRLQQFQAQPIEHFYGRNPIDLFWEFYGVEARPKEIQERIDELYDLFDQEKITEAKNLLYELSIVLGENDPIIAELTASINLMEELQHEENS